MYKTIEISDPDFTDDIWQEYFLLLQRLQRKYKLNLTNTDWKDLKRKYLQSVGDSNKFRHLLFFHGNTPFLFIEYYINNQNTPGQNVFFGAHGDFERIDSDLLKMIIDWYIFEFESRHITESFATIFNEHIWRLVESIGANYLTRQDQYYLYHDRANSETMRNWLNDIPRNNPDLRIELFTDFPESLLPDFVEHFNRGLKAMPHEETGGNPYHVTVEEFREHAEKNKKNNCMDYDIIIFNKENEIIGSTSAHINLKKTDKIHQLLTSIRDDYQHKGLAKWLKAQMYFKIKNDFPENKAIITEMRAVNDPILHINNQMGFILERTGKEFKLTLDALKSRRLSLERSVKP